MKPRFSPSCECVLSKGNLWSNNETVIELGGQPHPVLVDFFQKINHLGGLHASLPFLFQTDFTECHCPLYLQLLKRIKNRDQIQVRRRHFQLLQIDLNCKRSVITTIMITSCLLWSQINHVGRYNVQTCKFLDSQTSVSTSRSKC